MNELYERQQKAYLLANSNSIPAFNPVQFFEDQFTDVDTTLLTAHTSTSGHSWSNLSGGTGDYTINANRIYLATGARNAVTSAVCPTPHYYVEAVMDLLTDVTDNIGIIGRQSGVGNLNCYLWRYDRNADLWGLFRMINSVADLALGSFSDNWTTGSRTIRLEMVGNRIRGYTGGVLRVEATDNQWTAAGTFGLRGTTAMTTTTHHHFTSLIAAGNAA